MFHAKVLNFPLQSPMWTTKGVQPILTIEEIIIVEIMPHHSKAIPFLSLRISEQITTEEQWGLIGGNVKVDEANDIVSTSPNRDKPSNQWHMCWH